VNRYVDGLDSVDDLERYTPPPFMCLIEQTKGGNLGDVSVGMITICPSTGDVVWDDFDGGYPCTRKNSNSNSLADTLMRIELEVHDSIRVVGFYDEYISDETRTYETDRAPFTQSWPIETDCQDVGTLYWVSIIWWEALLNQQLF